MSTRSRGDSNVVLPHATRPTSAPHDRTRSVESFVTAQEAANFLAITRRRILELARRGHIPGHPIGDGARKTWRFRLSEIAERVESGGQGRVA